MGLDVKVYKNFKKTTNDDENADFVAYVINKDWEWKIKNLEKGASYIADDVERFISYAYSSHNRFREMLIKVIERTDLLDENDNIKWHELPSDIPFIHLIDFADNEGCLDWEVSNLICLDFYKFLNQAKKKLNNHEFDLYETWMGVFLYAKNNGVVVFS